MKQRTPREKNEAHRKFIGTLPCLLCGDDTTTECAHVSMIDLSVDKPGAAMASKSDDRFTVPLCGAHHRQQHEGNEREWWLMAGIDPVKVALALWSVERDYERGLRIVAANCERVSA